MKRVAHFILFGALFLAAPLASRAQSNVYSANVIGTIWELPPEQRAPFIADHSGSFLGIDYMHTKAFGWTFIAGKRSYMPPHSSRVPASALVAVPMRHCHFRIILGLEII